MRSLTMILVALVGLLFLATFRADAAPLEYNFDRPGGGGWSVPNVGSPQQCQQLCQRDGRCRAFTWVRPGLQGPGGRCWLKTAVTRPARNNCCVSGVKQGRDFCQWTQFGNAYTCKCKNPSGSWYQANPSSCPKTKPPPRYVEPFKGRDDFGGNCPFGQC